MSRYPQLNVNLNKLRTNCKEVYGLCKKNGIKVAAVIKGCSGLPKCAKAMAEEGADFIASSRLSELSSPKVQEIDIPKMLIRIPMISEAKEVVDLTDISLNSEIKVLEKLNLEAKLQGKVHGVILMDDLGDLREGTWNIDELIELAKAVENNMEHLSLKGIGTNLGCYGAIAATKEKMERLVDDAELVEQELNRKLEYISGGGTTSLPRLFEKDMPSRINLLRIGEGTLLARDLEEIWGYSQPNMSKDVFTIDLEVIEIKEKPTYPQGEIRLDGFGFKNQYVDKGKRKRALLGGGKVDYGFVEMLEPIASGIEMIGASSDHTIIDIHNYNGNLEVGEIISFQMSYVNLVYITHSQGVKINFIH